MEEVIVGSLILGGFIGGSILWVGRSRSLGARATFHPGRKKDKVTSDLKGVLKTQANQGETLNEVKEAMTKLLKK